VEYLQAKDPPSGLPHVAPTDDTPVRYVFTLVHGTWARSWLFTLLDRISGSVQWYEKGSTFRIELEKQFPGAVFEPSEWSGANSAAARMKAAINLSTDLRKRLVIHPHAHHFVIAHSHGGNIASYAILNEPEFRQKITGLIFLSTPFLHVHKRATNPLREAALLLIIFLGLFFALAKLPWLLLILSAVILPIIVWLYKAPDQLLLPTIGPFFPWWANFAPWIPWIDGSIIILLLTGTVWLLTRFKKTVLRMVSTMSYDTEILPPSFIVRTAGDEASAALTLCQVGTWLMAKYQELLMVPLLLAEVMVSKIGKRFLVAQRPPASLVYAGDLLIGFTFFLILCLPLVFINTVSDSILTTGAIERFDHFAKNLASTGNISSSSDELYDLLFDWIGITSRLVILLVLLCTWELIVLLPTLIGPLLCIGILGKEFAFGYLYVDVTVEVAPPGSHTIYQFTSGPHLKDRIKARLNHSIAYQSPQVITAITGWITNAIKHD
jgi:hypothetical protein